MNAKDFGNRSAGMAQPYTSAQMVGKLALGAAVLGIAVFAGAPTAQATFNSGLVDLQFVGNTSGSGPTTSGAAVIGSAGDVWNTIVGASSSATYQGPLALTLVDGSTASGATATISNETTTPKAFIVDYPGGQTSYNAADYDLLASQLVGYTGTTPMVAVSISGLNTSLTYNLYLYNGYSQAAGVGTQYTVSGSGSALTGEILRTSATSFVSGENYLKFTLSPDSSGVITVDFASTSTTDTGANLSGFQLQAVPEPASLGLLAVGGLGLLLLKRRRMA